MKTYLDDLDVREYDVINGELVDCLAAIRRRCSPDKKESEFITYIVEEIEVILASIYNHRLYLIEKPQRGLKYNKLVNSLSEEKGKLEKLMEQVRPLEDEIKKVEAQIDEFEKDEAEQSKWFLRRTFIETD